MDSIGEIPKSRLANKTCPRQPKGWLAGCPRTAGEANAQVAPPSHDLPWPPPPAEPELRCACIRPRCWRLTFGRAGSIGSRSRVQRGRTRWPAARVQPASVPAVFFTLPLAAIARAALACHYTIANGTALPRLDDCTGCRPSALGIRGCGSAIILSPKPAGSTVITRRQCAEHELSDCE